MSDFKYPFRTESGYGTSPGDEADIEALSRAVQKTEIYMSRDPVLIGHGGITTDTLVNLSDIR